MAGLLRRAAGLARRWAVLRQEVTYLYRHDAGMRVGDSPTPDGLDINLLSPAHVHLLEEAWALDVKVMTERFERGDRCYIARLRGRLVHYSWFQTSGWHPIEPAGVTVLVKPREAWTYHCYTNAEARGLGIYPLALSRILREAHGAGIQTVWIYTSHKNRPSQRGIERAGYELNQTLRAFMIGPFVKARGSRTTAAGQ
jgi:RimJ/RimL family protein N-acetyltransferase